MKKHLLLLSILPLLTLSSCGESVSDSSTTSQSDSTSSSTSESTSSTSQSSDSSSSSSSSSSSTSSSDDWFSGRTELDCGYYSMDLPKNSASPVTLVTDNTSTSWDENATKESIPTDFRYIYKNAYDDGPTNHKTSPNFYSSNNDAPGGIKFTGAGIGLQSKMFTHTGNKLEIRIGISQVNNASGIPVKNADTFHLYYFNNVGSLLGHSAVVAETITTSSAGNYVKIYCTESYTSSIAYVDLRMNANAYKGSQLYNVGVNYLNIKSWPQI
jgi:hypothetical protein